MRSLPCGNESVIDNFTFQTEKKKSILENRNRLKQSWNNCNTKKQVNELANGSVLFVIKRYLAATTVTFEVGRGHGSHRERALDSCLGNRVRSTRDMRVCNMFEIPQHYDCIVITFLE